MMGGFVQTVEEGKDKANNNIKDGKAWDRFEALVRAQGGDVRFINEPHQLPKAKYIETVNSPQSGYLEMINARTIGMTSVLLGAGRNKKGDLIDYAVGIDVHHKVGDYVNEGEPLFTIHANDELKLRDAKERLLDAHRWSNIPVQPLPLFYGVVK